KWTQNSRMKVYSKLVSEIGPRQLWDNKIRPKEKRAKYDKTLISLAAELSADTGEMCTVTAIQQQINFATTSQKAFKNPSHVRNLILNKAAALESGFLTFADLPQYLTVQS
ncbi:MAG TPA: hypothetical protein VHB20_04860, partial [Verrucomicrobiae bacterium]|nr:hypothetical protein [Verrucomicrobiae bacterium]